MSVCDNKGVSLGRIAEILQSDQELTMETFEKSAKYFNNPLTVDIIIEHYDGDDFKGIVLIKRKNEPYKDFFALPGGFVDLGEPVIQGYENLDIVETAAFREAKEEAGLEVELLKLVGVYARRGRDPRGPTVSVAYLAKATGELCAGDDAADVIVCPYDELPELAFDHQKIISDARRLSRY